MKFHFGSISKRPDILMDMCRHFISGSVYMIFYQPKWNFISVKLSDMKSIPPLSFKRTCALKEHAASLCLFISFRVNYVHMKITCRFKISFWSKWLIWNPYHLEFPFTSIHVNTRSWLNTEVRFSTKMKSYTGLSSLHLSYERTNRRLSPTILVWHDFWCQIFTLVFFLISIIVMFTLLWWWLGRGPHPRVSSSTRQCNLKPLNHWLSTQFYKDLSKWRQKFLILGGHYSHAVSRF